MTVANQILPALIRTLANAKVGIWYINVVDHVAQLTVDDYLRVMYGFPEGQNTVAAVDFIDNYVYPDDRANTLNELKIASQTPHYTSALEVRVKNMLTQTYRWLRISYTAGAEIIGGVTKISGTTIDISGDGVYQHALAEDKERLRLMIDCMPMSCHLWAVVGKNPPSFNLLDCNQRAVEFFGFTDKETSLIQFAAASPERQPSGESSMELAQAHLTETLRTGQKTFEWQHTNVSTNEEFPAEITAVRIKYQDGNDAIICYMRDLREEVKRRKLEERTKLIIENMPIGCHIWDEQLNLRYSNQQAAMLHGFTTLEDYKKNVLRVLPAKQAAGLESKVFLLSQITQALYEGSAYCEMEHLTTDGKLLAIASTFIKMQYDEQEMVMEFVQDLTTIKKALHEMEAARNSAEHNVQIKTEFIANMSHEIRTPLNGIVGFIYLLKNSPLAPREQNFVNKMDFSANNLLRVVDDIFNFSEIDAGKMALEQLVFEPLLVVNDVIKSLDAMANTKNLQLIYHEIPQTISRLIGDPQRVKQVLYNIMHNAVKFTQAGSVTLTISPQQPIDDDVLVLFKIEDTGIGMDAAHTEKIFSAFTQADGSTTRRYGGMGLGLTISQKLIELMHGEIWCASELGRGTTFSFTLRFALPAGVVL